MELTPLRLSKSARSSLSKTQSYREFLQTYFAETELSYAEVARRAGFSSRSYPRDVTESRRRLTAKALPSLIRGLRLDASLSRLFQALYFREFPEEHVGQLSGSAINAWISKERKRSVNGPVRLDLNINRILQTASKPGNIAGAFTEVIAALGEPGLGATLEEIHQRTGRTKEELALILSSLEKDQVIDYSADACRYLPKSGHINLTGFPHSEFAQTVFHAAVRKLDHVAKKHFSHGDALFMTSAISVKKADLPRLKKEMRELVLKFIDRNVEATDSPDTVVHLVNAIFGAPLTRT